MDEITQELFQIGCVKFGDFILNSGISSPFYIDLRILVSYPSLLKNISQAALNVIGDKTDCICGVPYGAIPLATSMSCLSNIPMIMLRKQLKDHGTPKYIEGKYDSGMNCMVVDDIIVSGKAILNSIKILGDHGLKVTEVFTVIDRQQGGKEALHSMGIKLISLFTISQVFEILKKNGFIKEEMFMKLTTYLKDNVVDVKERIGKLSFQERSEIALNPCSKRLFQIMHCKKTNLCFSADLDSLDKVIDLVKIGGPHICLLKLHADLYKDFSLEKIAKLKELSLECSFLIFEDRKYGDIGYISGKQHTESVFQTSTWADIVTVHPISGEDILDCVGNCFVVAEMSSKGTLATGEYKKMAISMADKRSKNVMGFITQTSASNNPQYFNVTPGINLTSSGDSQGQNYISPLKAVSNGSDILVVGRGIYGSNDPLSEFKRYQYECYSAYCAQILG